MADAIGVIGRQLGHENRWVTLFDRPQEPIAWLERLRAPGETDPAGIERDLRWLAEPGRTLLSANDPRYPALLADCPGHAGRTLRGWGPCPPLATAGRHRRQPRCDGSRSRDRLRFRGTTRRPRLRDHERPRDRHRRGGAPRRARRRRHHDRGMRHGARLRLPGGASATRRRHRSVGRARQRVPDRNSACPRTTSRDGTD